MVIHCPDKLFINNEFVSGSGGTDEVINPATEQVVGLAPLANHNDVNTAIGAARSAFDSRAWSGLDVCDRARILQKFHAELVSQREHLADLIVAEGGATRVDSYTRQLDLPLKHLQHCIRIAQKDFSRSISPVITDFGETKALGSGIIDRIPIGVVAGISAFNYPTFLNLAKIGPALMAGNTMVLKPSPLTPLQALALGEAARTAGLPPGVLNIVNGYSDVGTWMTTDPRVDLVSFTGSDTVGANIAAQASSTLKRVLLELGGKSALIVRSDGDLDLAARIILRGFTSHAGQGCGMFTRALIHHSVREKVVNRVAELAQSVIVGDPLDPKTTMGPLISASQRERTERYVALGREAQARIVCGGARPDNLKSGFFYQPTLFDDVDNTSAIAQDEVFGPVGCIVGFDTDDEAIALANDSKFGLRAGIISRNAGLAYEMSNHLQVGHILINGGSLTSMSEIPLGGFKRSGYGREGGEEGILAYTDARAIEFHAQ